MSASVSPEPDPRAQMVRIDRAIAATRKVQAEADRFPQARFPAPVVASAVPGGAIASVIPCALRDWGVP